MQTIGQLTSSGLSNDQALATINRTLDQQAYTMAATDLFHVSAALFFVLIAVLWLAKPSAPGVGAAGGGAH